VPAKFKNKVGYIINSYLLPATPPQKGVTTLDGYFKQISAVAGIGKVNIRCNDKGDKNVKTLYKNGMESHIIQECTEDKSEIYLLPEFTIQETFLVLRLLKYKSSLLPTDSLPTMPVEKDSNELGVYEASFEERTLKVERSKDDNYVFGITIYGGLGKIEIYQSKETYQTVVYWHVEEPSD
jgi:hypothetical protein